MLRISIFSTASGTTLKLEGVLRSPSLDELKSCWEILRASGGRRPICVDLVNVMRVGPLGEELLDSMRHDGVVVIERDR